MISSSSQCFDHSNRHPSQNCTTKEKSDIKSPIRCSIGFRSFVYFSQLISTDNYSSRLKFSENSNYFTFTQNTMPDLDRLHPQTFGSSKFMISFVWLYYWQNRENVKITVYSYGRLLIEVVIMVTSSWSTTNITTLHFTRYQLIIVVIFPHLYYD